MHPEPTNALINHTKDTYKDIKFDIIVAIGGGSIIDSAKAISIALTHKGDIWKYVDLKYRAPKKLINKPIDIVAVPTTSGTGSEATKNSVLINEKLSEKATIKFDEIYPKTALMCPSLTLGLNKEITCYTALDAFAHALESRININSNLFSNLYATKAINIFLEHFPKAIKNLKQLIS